MSYFKTRIWIVGFNTNIDTEEIDILRKYKYHNIFRYMDKIDFDIFSQKIEYKINKQTFQKLLTNPRKFNSGYRWNSNKNRLTEFSVEDHLTYVDLDCIEDEAHLLKSEIKYDENDCYFIESTWFSKIEKINIDDILFILDGINDGSNGGENIFSFNKQTIYNSLKKTILPIEICSLISEYTEDIYCFDISAMFPTTRTHSSKERGNKIFSRFKTKNKLPEYEKIMKFEF